MVVSYVSLDMGFELYELVNMMNMFEAAWNMWNRSHDPRRDGQAWAAEAEGTESQGESAAESHWNVMRI